MSGPAQWAEIFSVGESGAVLAAPKTPEYRGLPKDKRLRELAHTYMDDGVAYRMKVKVQQEVKRAAVAVKVAEVRQKKALARMVRDKQQLRNTAQFVRRQEKSLAGKIRAAEQRLKRYQSSVIAEVGLICLLYLLYH